MENSKTIKKTDEASKALIIEALAKNVTFGFDIDSIYYFETEEKWVIIEFLKCDHATVRPADSHPSRYWGKNWRKSYYTGAFNTKETREKQGTQRGLTRVIENSHLIKMNPRDSL